MYKFILFFALLGYYSANSQTVKRYIDHGSTDRGINLLKTSNSNLLLTGFSVIEGKGTDVLVSMSDTLGNILWTKTYGGMGNDNGWSILESEDGFFIYGFSSSFTPNSMDPFLLKINKQGDSLWMKSYGDENLQYGWGMTYDHNGDIVTVGQTSKEDQFPDVWITKIDRNGTLIWKNTLGTVDRSDRAFFIDNTEDGNFVITGLSAQNEKKDDDIYVAKFSSQGEIIWEKKIDYGGLELGHTIRSFRDHLFIFGYTVPENDSINHPMLIKLNLDGEVEWKKVYTSIQGHARILHGDFHEEGIIMTGYHKQPGKDDFDALALFASMEGELGWYHNYGGDNWDMGYTVLSVNRHFALIGHESTSEENIDLLLVIDDIK